MIDLIRKSKCSEPLVYVAVLKFRDTLKYLFVKIVSKSVSLDV